MSCKDCKHFLYRFTVKSGQRAGMCAAWGFSVNENDGRKCAKKEPKPTEGERIDTKKGQ